MTKKKKLKLLVVSPYGIGLRELLLNPRIALRIKDEFEMDVYTGLNFADPREWGIHKIIPPTRSGFLSRIAHSIDQRSVWLRNFLDFKAFFLNNGLDSLFELFLDIRIKKGQSNFPVSFWHLVSRTPLKNLVSALLTPFPRFGVLPQLIKNGNYDVVLTTHPVEGENSAAGIAANRYGVPLVCIPLGVDNMQNGPMQMDPDLFVLWGPEQEDYLVHHHMGFRPSLKNAVYKTSGAIPHDGLLAADRQHFDTTYPDISPDTTVVTFAAYTEAGYPGQSITCEIILSLFDRLGIDGHLVVRMRPDLDLQVWEKFLADHPERVTIQNPSGVLYSKWNIDRPAIRVVEASDYALFGATLKRSKLVVAASFSTVIFDAIAVGTPALASGLSTDLENRKYVKNHYDNCSEIIPALEFLDLIIDEQRLEEQVTKFLTTDDIDPDHFPNIGAYKAEITPTDGRAGQIALDAMIDLIGAKHV
jgi:hypothetical protein